MIDMRKSLIKHDPEIFELIKQTDQKTLAKWAIDCLNRVLFIYKERFPKDNTIETTLKILNEWISGNITMWEARKFCWKILALARNIEKEDKSCCQILRATSLIIATCHAPSHAEGSAMYSLSALQYFIKKKLLKMN